ncbi:FAD-binding oxidoreductase [Saccharolobus solfataricus]|uniref:Alkyldihydroxyacetonephosphate synthase (Precursor) n=3 Tax=Saccharolobus solfataricus TaxID=2287 RepID=Q97Y18_SACS2|nr:FAD-binding oxidoreductase [Saccharolobus solfataricus]AAK41753.1 Alkyldihydroxyacetonephosphate synthase (precursor) [Saccharolobus solfataricus P2]AKA74546.1 FAD-binding oxidoreductase [Saccharolobus solfataricus]AKA77242.1 FAD-binding oxidoreductase [Saccharolobus solfataricus]AKA79934.1 FAD-binding oxidoreductase [Saccharolobus solfataricus]AZF69020.1 FAD-binding oxidoreductase [Saccharolobus solfataricus]
MQEFINEIQRNFSNCVVEDLDKYKRDWTPLLILEEHLGKNLGKPLLVLSPSTTEEVSNIVKLANKYYVCIVPYGGGSSVVGGSYHNNCVILDLSKLNRIIEFNEEDLSVTVEVGIKIKDLEEWLNKRGYTLDYHPQSFYLATIGGAIAHKGSGSHSSSNIENLILWLEVILPNGKAVKVGSSIRTSMSPDLVRLFIGSEGTLGVITKAKLRIFPLAPYHTDLSFLFPNFHNAIKFTREYVLRTSPPHRIVVHDKESSEMMLNIPYNIALIRVRGYDEDLVNVNEKIIRQLAMRHNANEGDRSLIRSWREVFARKYEEQMTKIISQGLWNDTLDLGATWSAMPKLYDKLKESLNSMKGIKNVLSRVTHVYTNGASLYNVVVMEQDLELLKRVWETAARVIMQLGGTISHHHGVGILKKNWVKEELGEQYDLLLLIKRMIDSNNIMNPGKVFS